MLHAVYLFTFLKITLTSLPPAIFPGKVRYDKVNTTSKEQSYCSMTIAQSCVLSGTHQTTQIPSHGLGEPLAYGFQTLAKGVAL